MVFCRQPRSKAVFSASKAASSRRISCSRLLASSRSRSTSLLGFEQLQWCAELLGHHLFLHGLDLLERAQARGDELLVLPVGRECRAQPGRHLHHLELLGAVIGPALSKKIGLQAGIGIGGDRPGRATACQLLLEAADLGIQALQALAQLGLVGLDERGVEPRQRLALAHDLAHAHIDALDHSGLQGLHHHVGQRVDQPSLGHHHLVELRVAGPHAEHGKTQQQHMQRQARAPGHRAALDLVGIRQILDHGPAAGAEHLAETQPALHRWLVCWFHNCW
jgi:hypothetical protein